MPPIIWVGIRESSDNETSVSEENSFLSGSITNPIIMELIYTRAARFNPAFTKQYFSHLQKNMPTNNVNNCGYVALASVLGFYDAYLNDSFIPEQYEAKVSNTTLDDSSYKQSPCVQDIYENVPTYPWKTKAQNFSIYLDEMMKNGSFIGQLYSLAIDKGYLLKGTAEDASFYFKDYGSFMKDYLATIPDVKNTTISPVDASPNIIPTVSVREGRYYSYTPNFTYYGNTVSSYSEFRQQIVDRVKEGEPVIVGSDDHYFIVYDYDSKSNTLYGNLGWKGKNSKLHENIDSYYSEDQIHFWYSFDFRGDIAHSHSDNYILTDKDGTSHAVCSCELSSHVCRDLSVGNNYSCYCRCPLTHKAHQEYEYVSVDSTRHYSLCQCGRIVRYHQHELDSNGHCTKCSY